MSGIWLCLHKKHQTDCAISAAYARLASARACATFETLLRYTRDRAPAILSDAPITELTTTAQLRAETQTLKHCVAKYDYSCWRGISRIWSLRVEKGIAVRRIATIEFDPQRNAIVQARGYRNRTVSGRARLLLQQWAAREQVRLLA